jgi:hypothetical protein
MYLLVASVSHTQHFHACIHQHPRGPTRAPSPTPHPRPMHTDMLACTRTNNPATQWHKGALKKLSLSCQCPHGLRPFVHPPPTHTHHQPPTLLLPVFLSMTRLKLLRAPYGDNNSFTCKGNRGHTQTHDGAAGFEVGLKGHRPPFTNQHNSTTAPHPSVSPLFPGKGGHTQK